MFHRVEPCKEITLNSEERKRETEKGGEMKERDFFWEIPATPP